MRRKEAQRREDRARLDVEIDDWAVSIDRREVKRWIVEDLEKRREIERSIEPSRLDAKLARSLRARALLCAFVDVANSYHPEDGVIYSARDRFSVPYIPKGANEVLRWCAVPVYDKPSTESQANVGPLVDHYVVTRSLRKMREIYKRVMEEMGLIQPASRPIRSIEHLRQQYQEDWNKSGEREICGICNKNEANYICVECDDLVCGECSIGEERMCNDCWDSHAPLPA